MVQDTGQRAEIARDLRGQIAELQGEGDEEWVFTQNSPGRKMITLYSMKTGESIKVPKYRLGSVMDIRLPDRTFAFTADPTKAPEHKVGEVKCFLHPDAPERPILDSIGLTGKFCMSEHLPNLYQKRIHAQHRHRDEWGAYQEYLSAEERKKYEDQQRQTAEAMMALAGKAAAEPYIVGSLEAAHCDDCGWTGEPCKSPAASLALHQRKWCPANASEVRETVPQSTTRSEEG